MMKCGRKYLGMLLHANVPIVKLHEVDNPPIAFPPPSPSLKYVASLIIRDHESTNSRSQHT